MDSFSKILPVSLLAALFVLTSCRKESRMFQDVSLNLSVNGNIVEEEWAEICGGLINDSGDWSIDASSWNDGRFLLNLENITDTTTIISPTIRQISFDQLLQFRPAAVHTGVIRIIKCSKARMTGLFDVQLVNDAGTKLKISGSFTVSN